MEIKIPNWLAYQTYKYETEDSRTFISNERKHEYVLLEGLASDLWKVISDSENYEIVKLWAKNNGLLEELDGFLDELKSQDLLVDDEIKVSELENAIQPVGCENEEETLKLETEMVEWCSKNNYLYSLFIELTYNCNLKCVHCYNPKNISSIQIEFDKLKQIIDEAYELGCFKITFSGGEATLHKNFIEIIEYARQKRMSVEVYTNGQTLYENPKLFDRLLKTYPYRIGLSMYSLNKETHDKITSVQGSQEKTLSVIERLREHNVNVEIKDFLLNINCKDCIAVKNYANEIQSSSVADLSLIPTIEGDKKTFQYVVKENDLYALYTNPKSPLYVKNLVKRDITKLQNETLCYAGSRGLSISPTLDVYPCVSLPINLGNLNSTCLKNIWEAAINKKEDSKLYQWQQVTHKDLKDCYKEDYCAFCVYCAGMGMLENGYLKKSDILCRQAKMKQKAYYDLNNNSVDIRGNEHGQI